MQSVFFTFVIPCYVVRKHSYRGCYRVLTDEVLQVKESSPERGKFQLSDCFKFFGNMSTKYDQSKVGLARSHNHACCKLLWTRS